MNNLREKILLLLLGGFALCYAYTPGRYWYVARTISREWSKIREKELREGINYLYRLNYIDKKINSNNLWQVSLTAKGKLALLSSRLDNIKNKKHKWDGKWRMVAFDIPEKYKKGRDSLRNKLKKAGFNELQESVLVTPYDCLKEIKALVDFFKLGKYVRFGILLSIDNEKYFEKLYKL